MTVPLPAQFRYQTVSAHGVEICCAIAGSGPPALLLHGYPQTHLIWHHVAPRLAATRTVVLTDLRGYGDSSAPVSAPDHAPYSKRAMAGDQLGVMRALGFKRFAVVGHDRGGRVGHRMALDAPDAVSALAVVDIVPTRLVYQRADAAFGTAYYHWFFLTAPHPLPERLVGADPESWVTLRLQARHAGGQPFDPTAVAAYVNQLRDPARVHASCEDYRAAATIDLTHDDADARAGRVVTSPLLAVWGRHGFVGRGYDVLSCWREYASDVRGAAVDSNHYVPEEAPDALLAELEPFLQEAAA
ncbi:MAG: alpha/beta fold hydrolase [Dermatophilaceae bacterium]